jgi:signal transduction histidine kinase
MDKEKTVEVLLVEDSAFDAALINDLFASLELSGFELEHCLSITEAFARIEAKRFDCILLDLTLPEAQGLETFNRMYLRCSSVPIIALTRLDDEELALKTVEMGAQDYLIKGQVQSGLLKRAIRYGIERKRLAEELRGYLENLEEMVKTRTSELIETIKQLKQEIEKRRKAEAELTFAFDQLKAAQAQLIQAEKLETIGRLASGIAHEVKNPLAIILQGVEYLSKKTAPMDEAQAGVFTDMAEAVTRADSIVKELLDFSGSAPLEKKTRTLVPVIEKALLLVKHNLDRFHIEVVRDFPDSLPPVAFDANKFEQVFINIFENATHAMEKKGGRLSVKLSAKVLSEDDEGVGKRTADQFRPGEEAVVVCVEDTGTGIPQQFLDKVFDPFFTTKRHIGGTGLGLSIVRHIIETHNGLIRIENRRDSPGVRVEIVLKAATHKEGDNDA